MLCCRVQFGDPVALPESMYHPGLCESTVVCGPCEAGVAGEEGRERESVSSEDRGLHEKAPRGLHNTSVFTPVFSLAKDNLLSDLMLWNPLFFLCR